MSDGEIVKIDQRTGKPGRPKQVEIRGSKGNTPAHGATPEIVGASPLHGKTEIVDRTSKVEQPPMEVIQHHEDVTESEGLRQAPPKEDDVQVRVRTMTPEAREAWQEAKRGDA